MTFFVSAAPSTRAFSLTSQDNHPVKMSKLLAFALAAALCVLPARGQKKCALDACAAFPAQTKIDAKFDTKNWFGLKNSASFTASLRARKADREDFNALVNWFRTNEASVNKSRVETLKADCNERFTNWRKKAKENMKNRQIGEVDIRCSTSRRHGYHDTLRAHALFRRAANMFMRAGNAVAREQGWNNTSAITGIPYTSNEQRCNLERAAAVKVNGTWFILASVTNEDVRQYVGVKKRHVMEEWVRQDLCCPLTPWLNSSLNAQRNEPKPYSTILRVSAGATDISAFYSMHYDENEPLSRALRANALAVDQAEDAIRLSNIAILALPLMFSFIPVALIADVNDFAAFVYVLLTDFFSAVPFLIKGIELLRTGTVTQYVAETWLTGKHDLLVSEAWVASCKPRAEFARTGALFICIGLATIVSGFALEHLARKYMRKRILQGDDPRPFGDAFFNTALPLIPRNYSDEGRTPNFAADVPAPPPTGSTPFSAFYRRLARRRTPSAPNDAFAANTIGTGAGIDPSATAVLATARGPSPTEVMRAADQRWYQQK